MMKPAHVNITILPPVETAGLERAGQHELAAQVAQAIAAAKVRRRAKMRLGARLAVLLRLKPRGRSPAQRVQNPYRRLYPGRARVDAAHPFQKEEKGRCFCSEIPGRPGPRRGKKDEPVKKGPARYFEVLLRMQAPCGRRVHCFVCAVCLRAYVRR